MKLVQDEADDGPELPDPPTKLQLAVIGWGMDIECGCSQPRATALSMAYDTACLAIQRGVTPRQELSTILVPELSDPEVPPVRVSHGPLEIELEDGSATRGRAHDLVEAAQRASIDHSGWASIYFELMRGVCE